MHRFAVLYRELDSSTATNDKRAALLRYFREADPADAAWALWFLAGGKLPSKIANTRELRQWLAELSGLPAWLIDESYDHVGDLAETLSLLVTDTTGTDARGLADWVEHILLPLIDADDATRRGAVVGAWQTLDDDERLLFNKLLTGTLRVGVSQRLVQLVLAEMSGLDVARIAQRMFGGWTPSAQFFVDLLNSEQLPSDQRQPYPFFLASPLESAAAELGPIEDWSLEWKWDGIRLQLIRRHGQIALWSRGEERLDGRFPEIERAAQQLQHDCVIDGELLAWRDGAPRPFAALQTRIQRRKPTAKILADNPVHLLAYDLLEFDGIDLRDQPLRSRRRMLAEMLLANPSSTISLSPELAAQTWDAAARLRQSASERGVEGLMLKRQISTYQAGRRRGDWWKWKVDPLTIDAVLVYAQPGQGRRSTLFTDYTFGVWDGDALVPIAKAYSGLNDREIQVLDQWIRANTTERFGPVRAVRALHVFELGFEAVNASRRHKSGVAVRFPRILRWRHDKSPTQADRLDDLKALAR